MRKQLLTITFASMVAIATAAVAQVYVRAAPPPPRREVMPRPPRPGMVWQPGFNRWSGRGYVWVPGTFVAPPFARARWIPGHWRNTRRGWLWVDGHWAR